MKKITVFAVCAVFACVSAYAVSFAHHRPPAFRPHIHNARPLAFRPPVHHHRHVGHVVPGLPVMAGLAAGAAISSIVLQSPPVVVSPGPTPVWVPGVWVETRRDGIVVSRQWIEGHWEYR